MQLDAWLDALQDELAFLAGIHDQVQARIDELTAQVYEQVIVRNQYIDHKAA